MDCREQTNRWDFSDKSELWFDFVADMGDGWDASHAVAAALAQPELQANGQQLPRGELLLIGGDLVYPDPSLDAYANRTLAPYQVACESVEEFSAQVFALPGNHDWYDGLQAFQDVFCHDPADQGEWPFGHWDKPQTHSYFGWQLPHGWWLLAPDVQLDDRLNPSQRAYFRKLTAQMTAGDRVIIVSPYPHWAQIDPTAHGSVVQWLAGLCAEAQTSVAAVLTGDLHHYSRYSNRSPATHEQVQLVTSGGGGAFLHPTHALAEHVALTTFCQDEQSEEFAREAVYPERKTSRKQSYRNLLFPITNWELSLFVGFVYTMLAWVLETRLLVGDQQVGQLFQAMLANLQCCPKARSLLLRCYSPARA